VYVVLLRDLCIRVVMHNSVENCYIKIFTANDEQTQEQLNHWVSSVNSYLGICKHYREKITLNAVLRFIGMGKSNFNEFFKLQTGMTFIIYLNKVRIEKAACMLTETGLPCNLIGYDCGFATLW
jgi:YesN/AraC family two-component response regulator